MAQTGFIGLGSMGAGMAASLLSAGIPLTVHNRTAAKAAPLVAKGASLAERPEDLSGVDVLCSMLFDDATLEAVFLNADGSLALPLKPGAVHLSHSTISADCAARLARAHAERGCRYVAAPVLGRPDKAASGTLGIIVSGEPAAIAKARPALEAMSARIFEMGEDPTLGHVAKIGMNYMLASALASIAETFAMTRKSGIAPDAFLELLTGSIFSAPAYEVYGRLVAGEIVEAPGFKTTLGLKDVSLAVATARRAGASLPLSSEIMAQFEAAIAAGYADHDWASLGVVAARRAGLPPLDASKTP